MDTTNLLGYAATVLSSLMLFPQLSKTWKTKSTRDFSLSTLVMGSSASIFWLFYGILLKSTPVIIANILVMSSWLIILIFKLKYN